MKNVASQTVLAALTLAAGACVVIPAPIAAAASPGHHRSRQAHADAACPGANAAVSHASAAELRSAVVCLINQQRAIHHLPPLQASPRLNRSAQNWTNVMVATDQFTHGANFASRITAVGYAWRAAGENIATGFATPRSVVRAWMASTGHCENILSPIYRNVGTGVSRRVVRGFATGAGTWTQDFALGVHQSPPSRNSGPANGCPY